MSKTFKFNVSFDVRAVLSSKDEAYLQREFDKLAQKEIPLLETLIETENVSDLQRRFAVDSDDPKLILKVARGRLRAAQEAVKGGLEGFALFGLKLAFRDTIKRNVFDEGDDAFTFSPVKFTV